MLLLGAWSLSSWKMIPEASDDPMENQIDSCFRERYHKEGPFDCLYISIKQQKLMVVMRGKITHTFPISSSKYGIGAEKNSNKTPLGFHVIREKIGDKVPLNGILKSRIYTGKQAEIIHEKRSVDSDDVTTRILWLAGDDPGKNKGGRVDSFERYIYIHGTPEEGLIGQPASHGCIRMLNADVILLYNMVHVGMKVLISED